ncbi:hypothetical protein N7532_003280 [Penicillium argentinense]|uniref:Ankyrin n=1 Tax=Penicillium argentinense TaxID=1131581 RepID=A0A9W9KED5_9EURO|nr:uncharacterized protein N7532_003280 [Penicillium argentinense]KAJ5102751.1 hypothetical protein N7532_003280 [Penicillium argentinense]
MHITLLTTLLAAGTSAQFVQSFVPQVAHAYGFEGPGKWRPINQDHHQQHQQHAQTPKPMAHATPSTMVAMASGAKHSIMPMASSRPYASDIFAPKASHPAIKHHHVKPHSHAHATPSSYMAPSYMPMVTPTPTPRFSHALHAAPKPSAHHGAQAPSAHHASAIVPNGNIGIPAGGMSVPPSAEAPQLLQADKPEGNAPAQQSSNYQLGPGAGGEAPVGSDKDIAPVAPMAPGTNVAPVQPQKSFGADVGNSFCMGQCYPSEEEASCSKPYASPVLKNESSMEELVDAVLLGMEKLLAELKPRSGDLTNSGSLHLATAQGSLDIVQLLLDLGTDTSLYFPNGRPALHYAIRLGNFDIMQYLMQRGLRIAEVDNKDAF